MSAPEITAAAPPRSQRLRHSPGCWKVDGHHACAIRRVEQLRTTNLLRAYHVRGDMIKNLSAQNAKLALALQKLTGAVRRGVRR